MGIINLNIIKAYQTKRFLLFFSAAAFVWILNNLSDTFEKEISFKLQYANPNKDLFISEFFGLLLPLETETRDLSTLQLGH